jgi:hypothetical protein
MAARVVVTVCILLGLTAPTGAIAASLAGPGTVWPGQRVRLDVGGVPSGSKIEVLLDEIEQVVPRLENVATPVQDYRPVTAGPAGSARLTFIWPQRYLSCAGTAVMAPPASCRRPWKLHHNAVAFACYRTRRGESGCVKRMVQVVPKPHH